MDHKNHYYGLTDNQIVDSRKNNGVNILTPPERELIWKLFLGKFKDPIIRILLIAALLSLGISFVHWEFTETIGIFCAIFLATGVAFWFELDANKKFDVLAQVNDDILIKVIRNGNVCEVSKKDIVVGDIVIINTGDEIPADGELLEAISLQVDESCLTGETIVKKSTNQKDVNSESTYPSNYVMRSTKVMDGYAIFVVKKVGDSTEYGKVAEKSTEISGEETPLNKQLNVLAKFIGVVGFALAMSTFLTLLIKDIFLSDVLYAMCQLVSLAIVCLSAMVMLSKAWIPIIYDGFEIFGKMRKMPKCIEESSWLKWIGFGITLFIALTGIGAIFGLDPLKSESWIGLDFAEKILQYFMVAVTLIVVAVPEGIPMGVTFGLALSMRRMLKNNSLVRKMHACETMGATTVICTDKTGTLTQNQMQVYKTIFWGLKDIELSNDEISNLIKESISVNSTAYLDFSASDRIKTLGNPTEAALLLWLYNRHVNYLDIRDNVEIIEQITFSTERKYMATLVSSLLLNKKVLYVKGAPEIVLSMCKHVLFSDGEKTVSESSVEIENLLIQYQNQAMRTLGFAYEIINDNKERFQNGCLVNTNLTYFGIAAISDPVREDVPAAIARCLNAGIDVKIVTGDTPGTAKEIGRQIGLWNESDVLHNIITGSEFEALSDKDALQRVQHLKIMCRAKPTDKQRLVQLLQQNGSVVAVTGDGTNDAPALNFAHIGLSMGSGTWVAKEASDITLLDDSFNSITNAVMWGRSLYQNIQRFILFQLTINVAALIIVFLGSIFGNELPLTVTQMLWINLIMDSFAAVALASLPPNVKVMELNPRKNDDFIITPAMRFNILFVGLSFVIVLLGLIYIYSTNGAMSKYDLSRFFTIFVMLQFWNMFNAKAFLTGKSAFNNLNNCVGFLVITSVIFIGQILIVEFGGVVFRTVPLTIADWGIIIGSTSFVLWIGEGIRLFKRTRQKKSISRRSVTID